jgi:hypothetical protein
MDQNNSIHYTLLATMKQFSIQPNETRTETFTVRYHVLHFTLEYVTQTADLLFSKP